MHFVFLMTTLQSCCEHWFKLKYHYYYLYSLTEIYNFLGSIHFKGVIMDGVLLHFYYLVSLYFILYMHVYMCAFVSMSVYE